FLGLPDVAGLADFFTVDGHGDRPCVAEPEANLVVDRVVLRFALGEETDEEVLTLGVLYLDPAAVGRGEAHEHFAWFLGLLGDLVLAHRLDGDVFVHAGRGVRGVLAVTEELERGTQRVGGLALPGTYAHEEAQKDHDHDQAQGQCRSTASERRERITGRRGSGRSPPAEKACTCSSWGRRGAGMLLASSRSDRPPMRRRPSWRPRCRGSGPGSSSRPKLCVGTSALDPSS